MSSPARDQRPYPHLPRYHALNCTPEENERIQSTFFALFEVFRIVTWAAVLVWAYPHALDWLGGREVANWIIAHGWVRWIAAPLLAPCAFLSVLQPVNSPGEIKAASALAQSLGGTVIPHTKLDRTYGLPNGQALRVPAGTFAIDIRSWSKDGTRVTVAAAVVEVRDGFRFVAHGSGREPAILSGLSQRAMDASLDSLRHRTDDLLARQVADEMSFAASNPVTIGHPELDRACVLRTTDAAAARALLVGAGVAQALLDLHALTPRWSWSLMGDGDGRGELRLERPGSLGDSAAVDALAQPMRAALESLAAAGIIAAAA